MTTPRQRSSRRHGDVTGTFADIVDARQAAPQRHIAKNRTAKQPGRINLKAVAEVLSARGMDPTEEIVKIMRPVDDDGKPVACRLDPDVQARIHLELLQYVQPKLKSVEVRAKGAVATFDVSNEQAKAIAEEFLRRGVDAAISDEIEGDD